MRKWYYIFSFFPQISTILILLTFVTCQRKKTTLIKCRSPNFIQTYESHSNHSMSFFSQKFYTFQCNSFDTRRHLIHPITYFWSFICVSFFYIYFHLFLFLHFLRPLVAASKLEKLGSGVHNLLLLTLSTIM